MFDLRSSRWQVIAAGSVASVVVVSYFAVPGQSAWLPQCPVFSVTGLFCPGCGITRSLHALTHGHVIAALHNNLFLFFLSAFVGVAIWKKGRVPAAAGVGLLVFVLVFTVMRNLPWEPFSWLAPIPV